MFFKKGSAFSIQEVHKNDSIKLTASFSSNAIPKNDDFVYFTTRAVHASSAEGGYPNLNGDIFPLDELKKAYKTFIGRNLHLDHDTSSVAKAVGKVFDAKLMYDPEAKDGEPDYYVECLCGVDATAHPDIAQKVKSGVIDSVSMGASVGNCQCSICGKVCHSPEEFCSHLQNLGRIDPETGKLCASINHDVTYTELSLVGVPADPMAKMQQVFAGFLSSKINKKADLEEDGTKTDLLEKFSFSIPCGNEKICEMLYNELSKYSSQGISDLHIEGSVLTVSVEALNQDLALRKLKNISDEQGLVVKDPLKEDTTLELNVEELPSSNEEEEILMSTNSSLQVSASDETKTLRLDFKGSKEDAEGLAKKFDLKLDDYHKDEDGKTKVTFKGTKENLEKLHNEGFFDAPENEKEFMKFHEEHETKKEEDKKEAECSSEEKVEKEAAPVKPFEEEVKNMVEEKVKENGGELAPAAPVVEPVMKAEDVTVNQEALTAPTSTENDSVIAEPAVNEIETEAAPEKVEEEKAKVEQTEHGKEEKKDFKEEIKGPQEEKKEEIKEEKKSEDVKVDVATIKEVIKGLEGMVAKESAEKEPEEADKLQHFVDLLKGKKEEVKEEKKVEETKKEDGKKEDKKEEVKEEIKEEKPFPVKESSEVVNNDIPTFANVDRVALFKSANLIGSKWLFQIKGSKNPVIVSVKDLMDTKFDEKLAYFTSENFKNDLMEGIKSKAEVSKDTVMEIVAGFNEKIKVKPDEAASHIEHSNVKVKDEKDDFVSKGGKAAPEAEVSTKSTDDGKKQTEEKVNKKEEKSAVTYSTKKAPTETDLKMVAMLKQKIASLQSELANSNKKYENLNMSNLLAKKEAKCREIVKASMDRGLVQLNESFRKEAFEKCSSPTEAREIAWRKTADAMVHDLLALDDSDLDAKLQALSHFKVQAEVKEVVKPFNVQASLNDESALEKTIQALVSEME